MDAREPSAGMTAWVMRGSPSAPHPGFRGVHPRAHRRGDPGAPSGATLAGRPGGKSQCGRGPRGNSPALSLPGSSRQSMITAGACLGFGGDHGCPRTKCGHDSMGNAGITVAPSTRISRSSPSGAPQGRPGGSIRATLAGRPGGKSQCGRGPRGTSRIVIAGLVPAIHDHRWRVPWLRR